MQQTVQEAARVPPVHGVCCSGQGETSVIPKTEGGDQMSKEGECCGTCAYFEGKTCNNHDMVVTPSQHCFDWASCDVPPEEPEEPEEPPLQAIPLLEAIDITTADRHEDYGPPEEDFQRTAGMWSGYLGVEIKPYQVGFMMAMLKFSREVNHHKFDNYVDAAGYIGCAYRARVKLEEADE